MANTNVANSSKTTVAGDLPLTTKIYHHTLWNQLSHSARPLGPTVYRYSGTAWVRQR